MIPDRMKRVNEACREALGEIVQKEMKDPRVSFVTITKVEVSPDLRVAHVWMSVMGSQEESENAMRALERARGFMRRELGRRVRLRFTPELFLHRDLGAETSQRVQGVLHELERGGE